MTISVACPKCESVSTSAHCLGEACTWRRCRDCPSCGEAAFAYQFDTEHPDRGFYLLKPTAKTA